jgi:dienelactone hydrolase
VLILHGTHPGCPEMKRRRSLAVRPGRRARQLSRLRLSCRSDLAAQGYVALAININAENTFGFGEATPGERLDQLVDAAPGRAGDGRGRAAPTTSASSWPGAPTCSRLAIFGHSRGGEAPWRWRGVGDRW